MSETYDQYARDVYATVFKNMKSALHDAGKKSVLTVSGESHDDTFLEAWIINPFTPDDKEKPALAAAYAHVSAMTAAEKLVGKNNVIVSIEAMPERIKEVLEKFRNGFKPEEIGLDRGLPTIYALYHAYEKGFLEGFKKGMAKCAREIAKRLIADGIPLEKVSKFSKLSMEIIEKLAAGISVE